MSYDKQTNAYNRYQDRRAIQRQVKILKDRVISCNIDPRAISRFRKQSSMTCHCGTCRGWKLDEKVYYRKFELERKGMKTKELKDERPDIITDEWDEIVKRDEHDDL